jgi:hypothetical protein
VSWAKPDAEKILSNHLKTVKEKRENLAPGKHQRAQTATCLLKEHRVARTDLQFFGNTGDRPGYEI